jgi:hypothetical protein
MSTHPAPENGVDRCECGSKYWTGDRCGGCGDRFVPPTYTIIRFHQDAPREVIATGLTLDEAQAHCRSDDTHGDGWFDGYEAE